MTVLIDELFAYHLNTIQLVTACRFSDLVAKCQRKMFDKKELRPNEIVWHDKYITSVNQYL